MLEAAHSRLLLRDFVDWSKCIAVSNGVVDLIQIR